jgi:JAB domain-containing protein similar to deubiquitination enzymes
MNLEAGVVVGYAGEPIFWHLPGGRTAGSLPDSRQLWDVLWENRHSLYGVAHSHPGEGLPWPSREDLTTFAGVELGLGRRLIWWIVNSDNIIVVLWTGPDTYDYEILLAEGSEPKWLDELRRHSNY